MKNIEEMRSASAEELVLALKEKRQAIYTLVNQQKMDRKSSKPHECRLMRRDIARIHTILTEKKGRG